MPLLGDILTDVKNDPNTGYLIKNVITALEDPSIADEGVNFYDKPNSNVMGSYLPMWRTMMINTNPEVASNATPGEAVAHETTHVVERQRGLLPPPIYWLDTEKNLPTKKLLDQYIEYRKKKDPEFTVKLLKKPSEFMAYGLTHPDLAKLLMKIYPDFSDKSIYQQLYELTNPKQPYYEPFDKAPMSILERNRYFKEKNKGEQP